MASAPTASRPTRVVLFGATGRVGSATLKALVQGQAARPIIKVVARQPARLPVVDLPLRVCRGGIEDDAFLDALLSDVDAVLLVTGDSPRQVELETRVIDAAVHGSRPRVVKVSAMTAGLKPRISFGHAHGAVEDRLRRSGLDYTVLRPSFFFQSLELFAAPVRRHRRLVVPAADAAIAFVDLRDVGAVAAKMLVETGHAGRTYTLTGSEAWRFDEVADALAARIGHPVAYTSPPLAVSRAMMLAAGMSWWLSGRVVELFAGIRAAAEAQASDDLARLLGRSPLGLDDYLAGSWRAWSMQPSAGGLPTRCSMERNG